jgi:hypothetical protein
MDAVSASLAPGGAADFSIVCEFSAGVPSRVFFDPLAVVRRRCAANSIGE